MPGKGKNVIIVANKVDLEEVADIHRFTDILGETQLSRYLCLENRFRFVGTGNPQHGAGEGLSGGDSVVISNVRHKNRA